MSEWTASDAAAIGATEELELASRRPDGSLRPYVTMWVVEVDDELYVRSAYGSDNPWYRRAIASGGGSIRAGSVERDVRFEDGGSAPHDALDAAYHAKYDRYGPKIVGTVVGEASHAVTLRLAPLA
jgi:hypothetical protein